jgi:hypothetical protein
MARPKKQINAPEVEVKELVAPEGTKYTIEIEGKKCFLKAPSRTTFGKVLPMMSASFGGEINIVGAGEILLRECTIGGDSEFLTDDEFILPASLKALELFEMKEATLKKS